MDCVDCFVGFASIKFRHSLRWIWIRDSLILKAKLTLLSEIIAIRYFIFIGLVVILSFLLILNGISFLPSALELPLKRVSLLWEQVSPIWKGLTGIISFEILVENTTTTDLRCAIGVAVLR